MRTIPIADAGLLNRAAARERRIRAALVLAAGVLLVAAVLLAARSPGPAPAAARGAGGGPVTEVVLDVSGSVGQSASGFAGRALARIGHSGGRVGLILFSDSAQEALPPGTPAAQLLPFARSFTPPKRRGGDLYEYQALSDSNPWHPSFSGGTRISTGLTVATAALRRDRMHGTALLISDLGDAPSDLRKVSNVLLDLDHAGVGLTILPLPNALSIDVRWFKRLTGPEAFAHPLPTATRPRQSSQGPVDFPLALAVVAGLLAVVLAADELAARSLRWREAAE